MDQAEASAQVSREFEEGRNSGDFIVVLFCILILGGLGYILFKVSPDGFGLFSKVDHLPIPKLQSFGPGLAKVLGNSAEAQPISLPQAMQAPWKPPVVEAPKQPAPKPSAFAKPMAKPQISIVPTSKRKVDEVVKVSGAAKPGQAMVSKSGAVTIAPTTRPTAKPVARGSGQRVVIALGRPVPG